MESTLIRKGEKLQRYGEKEWKFFFFFKYVHLITKTRVVDVIENLFHGAQSLGHPTSSQFCPVGKAPVGLIHQSSGQ